MERTDRLTPELNGSLRAHNVKLPAAAQEASGIRILGRPIRSIVYTTDLAIIRNCDADAVFAVYPFTPQQVISQAIVAASSIPVFVGVGGGTTYGSRSAVLAHDAEADGAYGVVLNAPAGYTTIEAGANAVVCTPPTNRELFSPMMQRYRDAAGARPAAQEPRPISEASRKEIEARLQALREAGFLLG